MGERSDPFALFDQLFAARAEMESKAPVGPQTGVGTDRVQQQRDAERRERLGQLRAREHPGKRPNGMMERLFS